MPRLHGETSKPSVTGEDIPIPPPRKVPAPSESVPPPRGPPGGPPADSATRRAAPDLHAAEPG
ncbi:MAG: hypothetical protein RMJ82_11185, partial [Gemmatales bacterium]|nr:hypothetical protein [Gemmatales bacterium]